MTKSSNSLDAPPILRLHDAGDVIETVPYLLGFQPRESLVLVGIRDGCVAMTTRVDRVDFDTETVIRLCDALAGSGVVAFMAIQYSDTHPVSGWHEGVALSALLAEAGQRWDQDLLASLVV